MTNVGREIKGVVVNSTSALASKINALSGKLEGLWLSVNESLRLLSKINAGIALVNSTLGTVIMRINNLRKMLDGIKGSVGELSLKLSRIEGGVAVINSTLGTILVRLRGEVKSL